MEKSIRKLILISIIFSVTQIFNIVPLGVSLYQVVLFITFGVSMVGIIQNRYIKKGLYLYFAIINLMGAVIAFFLSTNPSWAKSYFLLACMMSMYVVLIPNYFEGKDLDLLGKTLIRSQYLTILLSIYSVYLFYRKGGIPSELNFFGVLSATVDSDAVARMQISGRLRLMLPYATPSVLSVVMGICILLLLYNKNLYKPLSRYVLIASFGVIMIFTGSRTGIAGLAIIIILKSVRTVLHNSRKATKYILLGLISVCCLFAVVILKNEGSYVDKLIIGRFSGINILSDRHFLVPIEGLIIWTDSIKNFLLGIGFGSSVNMAGVYTELPPYFLNSFVTFPVERGILGLGMDFILIMLAFIGRRKRISIFDTNRRSIITAFQFVVISNLFYELLNSYFIIILISCCFVLECRSDAEYIDYYSYV